MDPNLTYQIILNAPINATLNPAPTDLIKDWLPSITAIIVVIIGGFLTYTATIRIEEQKRHYELKKEVYFSVLEAIAESRQKRRKKGVNDKAKEEEELTKYKKELIDFHRFDSSEIEKIEITPLDLAEFLALNRVKVEICGSRKVISLFIKAINASKNLGPGKGFYFIVIFELVPAIREDLMGSRKPWYLFWKRSS
jgi:hypothetical protein